jgi:hypothetical protein
MLLNISLIDFTGLTALQIINGYNGVTSLALLQIDDNNAKLSTLNGFNALISCTKLSIGYAPLTAITGFSSLTTLGTFYLGYLGLTDLSFLSSVTLMNSLYIEEMNSLLNIDALQNLRTIQNFLYLDSNPLLTNLYGLRHVKGWLPGYLHVESHQSLVNRMTSPLCFSPLRYLLYRFDTNNCAGGHVCYS